MQEVLIKILSPIGVMLFLTFLTCKINPKKVNRYKQALFPYFALVYGIASMVYVYRYFKENSAVIDMVFSLITQYTGFNITGLLKILLVNAIIFIGHIVARFAPAIVVWFILQKKVLLKPYVSIFYEYSKDFGYWFLKESWVGVRNLFKILTYAGAVVDGLALGLIWYFGDNIRVTVMIFPAVVQILICEIYNFLNGFTSQEYVNSIGGDNSYAQKVNNYYKLRGIYEKIFPHELLSAYTGCDYSSTQAVTDLLESLKESEDTMERRVSEFFTLNGSEKIYDADCIHAVLKMLKGQNVIFFDPFYRDLGKYIILPFLNTLLSNRKVLVVVGRNSTKEDIISWVTELLDDYGKIDSLWRVKELDFKDPECEVGLLGFSQLYDEKVLEANKDFLKEVGFVFMLEPSLMINTGQTGLSILTSQMENQGDKPVYCIADRLVEGLVDTMSHLLQSEITEAVAAPIPRSIYTSMGWNADGDYLRQKLFDKQTKYLGNGLELAAVAVKNQISEVSWFGETKIPVRDAKWIAGQYYPTICRYMNQPVQQQSLYDKIKFISNIWCVPEKNEQFVIAEDEFTNLFATMRTFLSRGKNQTFVNILSENYLLRDYMRCNTHMFMSDPNAIPSIVPDYAKTERNVLLKLMLEMTYREVHETEILRELAVAGIETDDVQNALTKLLTKYTHCDQSIFHIRIEKMELENNLLDEESVYTINPDVFNEKLNSSLRNAYYICEDEDDTTTYIDAKLFGHITQTILPGQFVTYDGKYYIVKSISPVNGVVLRRASNLFDGRKYYKQIREYDLAPMKDGDIISNITVMDVEIVRFNADFKVNTYGYLELNSNNDLRRARVFDFSKDPSVDKFTRDYHNKNVLRIKLPDTSVNIRYSICMLLSELLKSVFPNAWQYIAVTTTMPEDVDGMLNYLIYTVKGSIESEYIYIIEDSELDLGLLDAVEKNLVKFFEIITDYLTWHFEKMREPAAKDPEIITPEFPAKDKVKLKKKKDLFTRIRTLFGGKKEKEIDLGKAEDMEKIPAKKKEKKKDKDKEAKKTKETDPNNIPEGGVPTGEEPAGDSATEVLGGETVTGINTPDGGDDGDGSTAGGGNSIGSTSSGSTSSNSIGANIFSSGSMIYTEGEEKYSGPDSVEADVKKEMEKSVKKKSGTPADGDDDGEVTPELENEPSTDIFDEDDAKEDPEHAEYFDTVFEDLGIKPIDKTRYQQECFLKFGFEEIDDRIRLIDVRKYLVLRGFSDNAYTKARIRNLFDATLIDTEAVNHCDFCRLPLSGVSYEKLDDGRVRCNDCASSAISSVDKFRELFNQVFDMMQTFYNIEYRLSIEVKTADAKKIAKGAGSVYTPTTAFDARVLGYACLRSGHYSLFVENGSPRLATILTMSHELTHIWQYNNWDDKEIRKHYPEKYMQDMVYEGMAMWVSIQYMYLIGESSFAQQQEAETLVRGDIYGEGFKMFCEKYPLIKDASLVSYTPFTQFPPL